MTRNEQYWIDRANRRMDNYTLSAIEQARIIQQSYNEMLNYVQSEIAKILRHAGGPDTLAYEYRIKRLNVLLAKTEARMQEMYGVNLIGTTEFLKRIIPEAYYHTIFDIAQGVGLEPTFSAVPTRLIDKIINENWSGENYSKRIWSNTNKLAEDIRQTLTTAAMTGESITKTSRKLAEAFNTSDYNARRLIRTETTYACNQAEIEAYKELDIKYYLFEASYSLKLCEVCAKRDGEKISVDAYKAGVNLPPLHPHCRCTTIPYFEDGMPEFKVAKDKDGKNVRISADMTYDEWYDKYIRSHEDEIRNRSKEEKKKKGALSNWKQVQKPQKSPPGTSVPVEIPAPQGADSGYTDVKIPKRGK